MARWLNREITLAANNGEEALLDVIRLKVSEFNAINMATALHRLARLLPNAAGPDGQLEEDEAFAALLERASVLLKLPPGPDCDARAVSTIAHALAGLGTRDKTVAKATVGAAASRLDGVDRQGLANLAWAVAKFPKVPGTSALAQRLASISRKYVQDFLPQELSSLLWSLGRLGVRDNRLMSAASDSARARLADFTGQGLATLLAAFSRMGVFIEPLLAEVGAEARSRLGELNGRDIAQILWSYAKFKLKNEALFVELCSRAVDFDLTKEGKELVVSLLWSFGTLRWVPPSGPFLVHLLARANELAPRLGAHRTVRLLTAAAKLSCEMPKGKKAEAALATLCASLAENVKLLADRMGAQEVGIASWALATLEPKGWRKVLAALCARAEAVHEDINWWSVAHLEFACRKAAVGKKKVLTKVEPLLAKLLQRCSLEVQRVSEESDAFQDEPAEAAVRAAPWRESGLKAGKVLVFGPGRKVRRALRRLGATVVPWKRFASGSQAGSATSPWPKQGFYDACAMRYPDSSDAFDLALHAAATGLKKGSPLWVYGDVREGALSATRALKGIFSLRSPVIEDGDSRIFSAIRTGIAAKGPFEAWLREESIDLGDGPRKWIALPGLFAGGLIDVMTQYLLESLADEVSKEDTVATSKKTTAAWFRRDSCCVLDFACGTGVLAAGFQRQRPQSRLWALDADAAAVEACQRNLPDAEAVVLGDGFRALQGETPPFELIISNPPVHRGHPDDLRVLHGLLLEAPQWMANGGELWLVAQEHIPVGRMLAECRSRQIGAAESRCWSTNVRMKSTLDGRFVVWSAKCIQTSEAAVTPRRKRKRLSALEAAAAELMSVESDLVRRSKKRRISARTGKRPFIISY